MEKTRAEITFNLHLRVDKLTNDLSKLYTKIWFTALGVYLTLAVLVLFVKVPMIVALLVTLGLVVGGVFLIRWMIKHYVDFLTVPDLVEIEMLDGWGVDNVTNFNRNELVTKSF